LTVSEDLPLKSELEDLFFKTSLDGPHDLHNALLQNLFDLFTANGYEAIREWPVNHVHYFRVWNMPIKKNGFIDLLAYNQIEKIAVEFDTGNELKQRSIEKLLESGADFAIGIVGARCISPKLQTNIRRVMKATEYIRPVDKRLWIVLLGKKIFEEISL
jgi:hypothetical protein